MGAEAPPTLRGYIVQVLMIIAINVPTVSFGLALGWVSLASGSGANEDAAGDAAGDAARDADAGLVGAAAATFAAGLVGVPLAARAIAFGRKPAILATSALFAMCWSLKLAGGWCVVAGRAAAGVAGAAAWCVAPLYATEMCSEPLQGAAAAAPVLAHNLGFLLMYAAADIGLSQRTVVWCSLAVSVSHCAVFLLADESPVLSATRGKLERARATLGRLRGERATHPAVTRALLALPLARDPRSACRLLRDMLSSRPRVRAFVISLTAVVGQECCGVLTLMQFAERVFLLAGRGDRAISPSDTARNTTGPLDAASDIMKNNATAAVTASLDVAATRDVEVWSTAADGAVVDAVFGASAARRALVLGAVQFFMSGAGLWLIERVGRRRLLTWGAVATGAGLALAAGAVWGTGRAWDAGRAWVAGPAWAAAGLALAVAADSAGLQPAPYAILGDMFHYEYRACAVLAVMAAASAGNAAETALFPALARAAGLHAALALSALLTFLYAAFAFLAVPETRGLSVDRIYCILAAPASRRTDRCHRMDLNGGAAGETVGGVTGKPSDVRHPEKINTAKIITVEGAPPDDEPRLNDFNDECETEKNVTCGASETPEIKIISNDTASDNINSTSGTIPLSSKNVTGQEQEDSERISGGIDIGDVIDSQIVTESCAKYTECTKL